MAQYVINRAGPNTVGSTGETDETGRMNWTATPVETPCMVPHGPHSDDVVEVWHGLESPAVGCGFHATHYAAELFAAHRELV